MNFVEKLQQFADLATMRKMISEEESGSEYHYFDTTDPENIEMAKDYFDNELGFLDGQDRRELRYIWEVACEDNMNIKPLFNAIKVL